MKIITLRLQFKRCNTYWPRK